MVEAHQALFVRAGDHAEAIALVMVVHGYALVGLVENSNCQTVRTGQERQSMKVEPNHPILCQRGDWYTIKAGVGAVQMNAVIAEKGNAEHGPAESPIHTEGYLQ